MHVNFGACTAGLDLIERHLRLNNDIRRSQSRQILVFQERTANTILSLADAKHRPSIAELGLGKDRLVCNVGEAEFRINDGI
jgi:hypothetical protein